jgi:hypothetical protein
MSTSAVFGDELDRLGVWWPRGDGDALRSAADVWGALADVLDDAIVVLDAAAQRVVEHHSGDAAQRFAQHWSNWSGASGTAGYLAQTAADCRRLAGACADFGTDVDVADRAIVQLIETALAARTAATATGPAWETTWTMWFEDGTTIIGQALADRADLTTTPLTEIGPSSITAPSDLAVLDAEAISWPEPGMPIDFAALGSTVVDFGAGQGDVRSSDDDDAPGFGAPGLAPVSGGGVSIVINGDGNTVTVDGLPATITPPAEITDPALTDEPAEDVVDPLGLGDGLGGVGGGGFGGGGFGAEDFAIPELAEPVFEDPAPPLEPSLVDEPVVIRPPIGFGEVATVGAVAAAAGSATRMPFMPMMPMAGSMSADEGEEPRRRRRRSLPHVPPPPSPGRGR